MKFEIHGHIHKIFPTKERGASKFLVREFIVETDGRFPQFLKFEVTRDKCEKLDKFGVAEPVLVAFNLKGRKWSPPDGGEDKFFISLEAWRIETTEHAEDRNERSERSAWQDRWESSDEDRKPEQGKVFDDTDIPF